MNNRSEVREFLTTRRGKVTPEQAGIPAGSNRRVPGLRRGEVAMLSGVSVEYYSKLERGDLAGVSESVLAAIARTLRLSDAEREHLMLLARAANGPSPLQPRRKKKKWQPRPGLQQALDAITAGPAFVRNGRMDILAANTLGRAMWATAFEHPGNGNIARFNFLDRRARDFYPDWEAAADVSVAIIRTEAGRDPHDKDLQDLVGELSTVSAEFRRRWGAHDVRHHGHGAKGFHHAIVGDLALSFEGFDLAQEPGLALTIYTAEPGSTSEANLRLLASWAATLDRESDAASTSEAGSIADAEHTA